MPRYASGSQTHIVLAAVAVRIPSLVSQCRPRAFSLCQGLCKASSPTHIVFLLAIEAGRHAWVELKAHGFIDDVRVLNGQSYVPFSSRRGFDPLRGPLFKLRRRPAYPFFSAVCRISWPFVRSTKHAAIRVY